jgi:hypothetical protein
MSTRLPEKDVNPPRSDREIVYMLWYERELNGEDEELLIGVYRTESEVREAIERLKGKRGFADDPEGFHIYPCELNRDHWTDGFIID